MSNDVLGRIASNIGMKDLVQTAVCTFVTNCLQWCIS